MSMPLLRLLITGALLLRAAPLWAAPKSEKKPSAAPEKSPLVLLEKGRDPLRRESAALVLGRARVAHALPLLLLKLRRDESRWVRAACAEALGQIGDLRAVEGLRLALGREKNQRVRRRVGEALMRLGHKAGLLELMWQLRAGSRHDRAEAMRALVRATGQPLGQNLPAWWTYLARRGYRRTATRPHGSPAPVEIGGTKTTLPLGPDSFRRLCAATLHLEGGPFGRKKLEEALTFQAPGAEGCWLLLATHGVRGTKKTAFGGLTREGAAYLIERFPNIRGLGVDRESIAARGQEKAVREVLGAKKLATLVDLKGLHQLLGRSVPLMAIARGRRRAPLLLALLP